MGCSLQHASHLSSFQVDAGASFIITQFFFEVSLFANFVQRCRRIGITVPIIPGIMLVQVKSPWYSICIVPRFSNIKTIKHNEL
jgi:hypothetical protein